MKMKKIVTLLISALLIFQASAFAAPYNENLVAPGIIEAEDYDADGAGVSYGDTDTGNLGGACRTDDVDIYTAKSGGNYVLMTQKEWLKYTFYVDRAGSYEVFFNAMVPMLNVKANIYIDDIKACTANVATNSKNAFVDISAATLYLKEGAHTLTVENTGNDIQLDYIRFEHSNKDGAKTWDGEKTLLSVPTYEKKGSDLGFPTIDFRNKGDKISDCMTEIYVAENGSDENDGTEAKPFKTVAKAIEEVRKYNKNMTGDIKVKIGSGRYYITEALKLGLSDSATNGFSIIYEGASDGSSIIDGGKPYTFQKVEGKPLWVADVESDNYIYEFFVNDHRAKVASTEYEYWANPKTTYTDEETGEQGLVFKKSQMPLEIDDPSGVILWSAYEWVPNFAPVTKFFEKGDEVIVTVSAEYAKKRAQIVSGNYGNIFRNHISFLDRPGEFYYDKKAQKLYYYPFENEKIEESVGYLPVANQLVNISGESLTDKVNGITFKNIAFRHTDWKDPWFKGHAPNQAGTYTKGDEETWWSTWNNLLPASFYVTYADSIYVENCDFENLGPIGVHFHDAVENSNVTGNTFYDIGGEAVMIGSGYHCWVAGRENLACRYISVDNNLIRQAAQIFNGSCGITAFYVNNTKISHNDIEDLPYSGISMGWGWGNDSSEYSDCEISDNRICNVMHTCWDGSNIYMLGDSPRTVISGNYLTRTNEWCGGNSVYFDTGSQNYTLKNNVYDNQRVWNTCWGNADDAYSKQLATIKHISNYTEKIKTSWRGYTASEEQLAQYTVVGEGGEWPEAAQKIIKNAGLSGQYKKLLENYEKRDIVENIFCSRKDPYINSSLYKLIYCGRDFIKGEEGETYHDSDVGNNSDGFEGGPDYGGKYWNIGNNGPDDLEWFTFNLKVDKTGDYTVYLGSNTTTQGSCELSLDGKVVIENGIIESNGGWAGTKFNNLGKMHLEADKDYILKFAYKSGATNTTWLGFSLEDGNTYVKDALYSELTD